MLHQLLTRFLNRFVGGLGFGMGLVVVTRFGSSNKF